MLMRAWLMNSEFNILFSKYNNSTFPENGFSQCILLVSVSSNFAFRKTINMFNLTEIILDSKQARFLLQINK